MQKLQFFLYGILLLNITSLYSCDAPTPIFYQSIVYQYRHLDKGFHLVQLECSFYDFLISQLSCKKLHGEDFSTEFEEVIARAEYSILHPMRDTFLEIITKTARKNQPYYENLQHPYFLYIQKNHRKFSRPWIKKWIDTQDNFGNSLLHTLVNIKVTKTKDHQPNYQMACLLHIVHNVIAMGADVHIVNNNGTSPLHLVHNNEVTKILLRAGAHPNIQNRQGLTPLHMACRNTHDQRLIKLLLRYRANPQLCDQRGIKPIHEAAQYNHDTAIQDFIQAGVNVNSEDNNGWTPLHYAAKSNSSDVITQLLIRHNADIDSRDQDETTPLCLAVQYNHQATVQTLLNAGADITILDQHKNLRIYKEMHDILQQARNQPMNRCTIS